MDLMFDLVTKQAFYCCLRLYAGRMRDRSNSAITGRWSEAGWSSVITRYPVMVSAGSVVVRSGRDALPGLLPVGFPGPPAEPGVRLSPHRALRVS
jgi:hypothetical protein